MSGPVQPWPKRLGGVLTPEDTRMADLFFFAGSTLLWVGTALNLAARIAS